MVKIVAKIEGGSRLQQLIHDMGWVNMLQSTLSHQSIIVAFSIAVCSAKKVANQGFVPENGSKHARLQQEQQEAEVGYQAHQLGE